MDDVEIRMECLRIATKFASAGKTNDVGLAEAYYRFVKRIDARDFEQSSEPLHTCPKSTSDLP